jgi:hypothetical protein
MKFPGEKEGVEDTLRSPFGRRKCCPCLAVIGTKPSVSADPSAFKAPLVDELNFGVTDFAKTSRDPSWINIPTFPGVAIRDKFGNEHWLYGIAFVYLRLNPAGGFLSSPHA